ncbi:MAG: trimethylamine methyltransferase family protein [Alphaproteobacteria bacterium]
MVEVADPRAGRRSRRKQHSDAPRASVRPTNYRKLRNPFPPLTVFSEDRVQAIHETSMRVLQELGLKILLPEAFDLFEKAGAMVDRDTQMVRIGREIIEDALASAPKSIPMIAGAPHRNLLFELGTLAIQTGGGAPHLTDLVRGRRPGSLSDYTEIVKLTQSYDVLHMQNPAIEPQDVPINIRHLKVTNLQLSLSDKIPFVFARSSGQTHDVFEMIRMARGLSEDEFSQASRCFTIINTNSPRQIDIPMAQGLIDFARAGQVSIVTPFCLAGAMAPITVAGALTLSHAESMAGIALTQLAKKGAPVCYGSFISNVDMKSGAPAFGTPEQVKASLASGQMARLLGLPWRNSAGSAANINDAQAANENTMAAWGAMMAGCTVMVHGAGWLEGGLTVSLEKLITDLEVMQMLAELCVPVPADDIAIGFETIKEVAPGGHFFAAGQTMDNFTTAFYEPLVADWNNFGTWTDRGSLTASDRATKIWQRTLNEFKPPPMDKGLKQELQAFVDRRIAEGGAFPVS